MRFSTSASVFYTLVTSLVCLDCALAAPVPPPSAAAKTPIVKTLLAQVEASSDQLNYPARIQSSVSSALASEIDGIVTQVLVPLGQRVKRRQSILRLEHTDPVYQYAPVFVRSPIEGVVAGVEVTTGSQVTRGQKLAIVTDPSKIKILVEVPAQDVKRVSTGLEGDFWAASLGQSATQSLKVRILGVSPWVDPGTGTSTAELEFVDPSATVRTTGISPGLIGQIRLQVNARQSILVPEHVVVYRGKETMVRLVVDGKSKEVAVRLGKRQQGRVEIESGLNSGDRMIERASIFVANGEKVIVEDEAPAASAPKARE